MSITLKTERLRDGKRKLLARLRRDIPLGGDRMISIHVPASFKTDFSSIPQCFAWIVRWSKVDVAGVVHDYMYSLASDETRSFNRAEADEAWRAVALRGDHSANRVQARLCWLALRLFGWLVWMRR